MTPQYIHINKYGSAFHYKDKAMKIFHREDGPAIEYNEGDKVWYLNNQLHREDGPAVECPNGHKEWWVNGVYCTEEEFKNKTAKEIVLTLDEIAEQFGIEVSKLKIAK